jgi:hypothetical protein
MRFGYAGLALRSAVAAPGGITICIAIALLAWLPASPADILHLASGATVEGEILETDDYGYRVRTVSGTVKLPAEIVTQVEKCPSPFEEYEQRRQQAAQAPEQQMALAEWCGQRGLKGEHRKHLLRVLELDRDYAPARAALGYVRVGRLWVDGRSLPQQTQPDEATRAADRQRQEQEKLVTAIRSQWFQQIRVIKTSLLESPNQRQVQNGREKILQIRDPLAILPLARELSQGNRVCRQLLAEVLSRFPQDEATMNLAVLALVDPDEGIREATLRQLRRRDDPRIPAQFRQALRGEDWLVRRAARGLGMLRVEEAVPELINSLTAQRRMLVEVPVRGYINNMPRAFDGATQVVIGGSTTVVYSPTVGIILDATAPTAGIRTEWQMRDVTVYRTEVLEALKEITGQNFGFDSTEWRRWYEEHQP